MVLTRSATGIVQKQRPSPLPAIYLLSSALLKIMYVVSIMTR